MISHIKGHKRIYALIFMLAVAIPSMLSPIGVFPIRPISNERLIVMDGVFSYDFAYICDVFERLDAEGRCTYFIFHIFDCIFALSYCLLMMALLNPLTSKNTKWVSFVFPILPAILDCTENILIQMMSFQYPSISQSLAATTSIISGLKWCAVLLWFIVFAVMMAITKTKKRTNSITK